MMFRSARFETIPSYNKNKYGNKNHHHDHSDLAASTNIKSETFAVLH